MQLLKLMSYATVSSIVPNKRYTDEDMTKNLKCKASFYGCYVSIVSSIML